jgi:hypothetical protein
MTKDMWMASAYVLGLCTFLFIIGLLATRKKGG